MVALFYIIFKDTLYLYVFWVPYAQFEVICKYTWKSKSYILISYTCLDHIYVSSTSFDEPDLFMHAKNITSLPDCGGPLM